MSTNTNKSSKRINPFLIPIVALIIVVFLVCFVVPNVSQATPTLLIWIIGISVLAIIVLIVPFCLYEVKRPTGNAQDFEPAPNPKVEQPQNNNGKAEPDVIKSTMSKFRNLIFKFKNLRKSKK